MSDCRNCLTPLDECNRKLREVGETCCPPCILSDTHQLVLGINASLEERFGQLEQRLVELTASQVIWRTNVNNELRRLAAQAEKLADWMTDLEPVEPEDRIQILDSAAAEIAANLPDDVVSRLIVLEACLTEIETMLKLRRAAATPTKERRTWMSRYTRRDDPDT